MSEEKKKFTLSPFQKKLINIAIDVVCGIVLLFALLLAIFTIRSKAKKYAGYTEVFGKAYLAVETNSMAGDKKDNFDKGDMIVIKTLKEDKVKQLKEGDVITFETTKISEGKRALNSHRIIKVNTDAETGEVVSFTTQGDNNKGIADKDDVKVGEVVGVFKKKTKGIGKVFLFMNSSTGFMVCIVLPTLIVVVYCAINLIFVIKKEKVVQSAAEQEEKSAERERIRAELMAEMNMQNAPPEAEPAPEQVEQQEPVPAVVVAEAEEVKEQEPAAPEKAEEAEKPEEVEKPKAKTTASKPKTAASKPKTSTSKPKTDKPE